MGLFRFFASFRFRVRYSASSSGSVIFCLLHIRTSQCTTMCNVTERTLKIILPGRLAVPLLALACLAQELFCCDLHGRRLLVLDPGHGVVTAIGVKAALSLAFLGTLFKCHLHGLGLVLHLARCHCFCRCRLRIAPRMHAPVSRRRGETERARARRA